MLATPPGSHGLCMREGQSGTLAMVLGRTADIEIDKVFVTSAVGTRHASRRGAQYDAAAPAGSPFDSCIGAHR